MARSLLGLLLLFPSLLLAAANGAWLKNVPAHDRIRQNPYAENQDAVGAGAVLYRRSCASCHGEKADGIGARPNLHSERVHQATDGELHWLLTNGDLRHGMPSWSRLPDAQRWQIVRYLHSLPVE